MKIREKKWRQSEVDGCKGLRRTRMRKVALGYVNFEKRGCNKMKSQVTESAEREGGISCTWASFSFYRVKREDSLDV